MGKQRMLLLLLCSCNHHNVTHLQFCHDCTGLIRLCKDDSLLWNHHQCIDVLVETSNFQATTGKKEDHCFIVILYYKHYEHFNPISFVFFLFVLRFALLPFPFSLISFFLYNLQTHIVPLTDSLRP